MVYTALLPLMCTTRLPVFRWTDIPTDLNGLVRYAERWNLVSAHVPTHLKRSLPLVVRGGSSSNTYLLNYLLTPRCRVLTGLQLVKKFPAFTEPEGSLRHSQASDTCLYPGPAQSSPHTHIPPPGDPSTHLHLGPSSGLFPSGFTTKTL